MSDKIDIVIPWVDGNDPHWLQEKSLYDTSSKKGYSNSSMRFREWGLLKFVLRGIEKNMPWVNTIHFLTYGHTPDWLKINHPQLRIVSHKDFFINKKDLPTFSSHAIEANLRGIKNLSEKFIYFNDDMIVLKAINKERFFVGGKPVDFLIQQFPRRGRLYRKFRSNNAFSWAIQNGIDCINSNFNKKDLLKSNKNAFYSDTYSLTDKLQNYFYNIIFPQDYAHIMTYHHPQPYLKSTLIEVYKYCSTIIDSTSRVKFRGIKDVNQYINRYWQIASNNFYPYKYNDHKYFKITNKKIAEECVDTMDTVTFICPNDSLYEETPLEDVTYVEDIVIQKLMQLLPEKSSFEK